VLLNPAGGVTATGAAAAGGVEAAASTMPDHPIAQAVNEPAAGDDHAQSEQSIPGLAVTAAPLIVVPLLTAVMLCTGRAGQPDVDRRRCRDR
jgi:hypothetical protein